MKEKAVKKEYGIQDTESSDIDDFRLIFVFFLCILWLNTVFVSVNLCHRYQCSFVFILIDYFSVSSVAISVVHGY